MEVGLRVVRGPDWKWHNQDGGEGCVGTVVEISDTPEKTVYVLWDLGSRENYRVGYHGAYDLRVYDNASTGVRHPNIICDGCREHGVMGIRWECLQCYDYDLCHLCYMNDKHDLSHAFKRYDTASSDGVEVQRRASAFKIRAQGIFFGATVVRGPDWQWGNQDGGEGKQGTVVEIRGWDTDSRRGAVTVDWSSGQSYVYRLGHQGKVDLQCIAFGIGDTYYKDHLPVLGASSENSPTSKTHHEFKVHDTVRVDLEIDILKDLQEDHGGWSPMMTELIGKLGTVHGVTEQGDVLVKYEGCEEKWVYHPAALTKFDAGDLVQVSDNFSRVRDLQKGHGERREEMTDLQMQETRDNFNCRICMDRPCKVVFLCGHSTCAECAQKLKECHMCRKPITKKINLFL